MKLFEHPKTEEATPDALPELPPDVEVPDDISTLRTPTKTGGVRWMRWLVAFIALAGAGIIAALVLTGDDAVDTVEEPAVEPMEMYGTDNPGVLVDGATPRSVVIDGTDPMALYGTDNPTFVPAGDLTDVDPAEVDTYMDLYGTDNPSFVPEAPLLEHYGTDNPVFVD